MKMKEFIRCPVCHEEFTMTPREKFQVCPECGQIFEVELLELPQGHIWVPVE